METGVESRRVWMRGHGVRFQKHHSHKHRLIRQAMQQTPLHWLLQQHKSVHFPIVRFLHHPVSPLLPLPLGLCNLQQRSLVVSFY